MGIIEKIFGTHSEHELKRIYPIVDHIDALEPEMQKLSDEELKEKTKEFKERLAKGETLDDLLPEAFAVVREAAVRVLGMRHYRVQMIGGIILHQGRIAEMKTGEGKTLVSTLPAYLNALTGEGVHIVTVNDYLAKRDAEWMGKVHEFLGLTVGVVLNQMDNDERRGSYELPGNPLFRAACRPVSDHCGRFYRSHQHGGYLKPPERNGTFSYRHPW